MKMGLRKIITKKTWKELHIEIKVEVDGKPITLPPVEGIIILNILRYVNDDEHAKLWKVLII